MTVPATRPRIAFADVPQTPAGHLGLYLYLAAAHLAAYLRRLAVERGEEPDSLLSKAPFLNGYEDQLRARLSGQADPEAALEAWESLCDRPLPFHGLSDGLGLDLRHRLAFAMAGLPEEDSRFSVLFGELQGGVRRPTVELLGRIFATPDEDGWMFCRPLIACGLLTIDDLDVPRAEQSLRIASPVWDAVRGELGERPLPGAVLRPLESCPKLDELLHPADFLQRLDKLPRVLTKGATRVVLLRHAPGVDVEEIAAALARNMQRGLLRLDRAASESPSAGPLLSLAGVLPLVEYETGPGDTVEPPELRGYAGPLLLSMGFEGGLRAEKSESAVVLEVPFPTCGLREMHWRQAFDKTSVDQLDTVRDRFQIAGGYIRTVAKAAVSQAALDGRGVVTPSDVRAASRLLNRQLLDSLAQPVEARGQWSDLVASRMTRDRLAELQQRCVMRERLAGEVGQAFQSSVGRGVRALFAGASGTGKTMAARILAAGLGMDLYRVDLAAVVNKYVGETEKNLHLVLSRAEALDVILLLDEGDALMGKRSEVRSSNDRYANLETNYLLQRLESYQGVVIVTTNFAENIDPAFQRRMDVVTPFFTPRPDERRRIWDLHLPASHGIDAEWFERVVQRCGLTGGQIRNAVLQAVSLALDGGRELDQTHIHVALLREYQKAGASFPLLGGTGRPNRSNSNLGSFVSALRAR